MSNPHCWPSHIRGHVYPDLVSRWESVVGYLRVSILLLSKILNLVPRAHMPPGQHQDTELWNNQQSRSQSPRVFWSAPRHVDRKTRGSGNEISGTLEGVKNMTRSEVFLTTLDRGVWKCG